MSIDNQILLLEDQVVESLPKPKALALDLDLTLHDVINHYDYSINETLLYFGYRALNAEELEEAGKNFTSSKDMLAKFLPEDKVDEALEYYFNHFLMQEIPPKAVLPGARELLYLIRKRFNLPIVAITNSEEFMAKKILRDLNTLDKLDYIIGVRDDFKPKPDPQMLLKALEFISLDPGPHVWFIGDRPTDTECARNTNCTAVRFYHKVKPVDNNADLFINSHYHLFNIIDSKLRCA